MGKTVVSEQEGPRRGVRPYRGPRPIPLCGDLWGPLVSRKGARAHILVEGVLVGDVPFPLVGVQARPATLLAIGGSI